MIINWGRLARPATGLFVGIALVTAASSAMVSAAAHAPTPVTRGGYVVEPAHLHSASMQFRVPRLTCSHASTAHLSIGMFGHTVSDQTTKWYAAIGVFCHDGAQRSFAVFGDFTPADSRPVHAGDLIRISTIGPAPTSTVADLTTGARLTGGPAALPGQKMVPEMLMAGRRTGSSAGRVRVVVDHATVNGHRLSSSRHHTTQQVSGRATVARAGALDPAGSGFSIEIS